MTAEGVEMLAINAAQQANDIRFGVREAYDWDEMFDAGLTGIAMRGVGHVRGCVELLMRSLKPKRERSAPAKGDALTVNSVARQLHVSPDTVRGWIKSGQLKASNLATGPRPRYAIIQDELDAFLKRREAQPPAKRERKAQATVAFKRYRA